jgi:hypothetical protein
MIQKILITVLMLLFPIQAIPNENILPPRVDITIEQWRIDVDKVEEAVWEFRHSSGLPDLPYEIQRTIARALVAAGRATYDSQTGIQGTGCGWEPIFAIAGTETKFTQEAIGKAGEVSIMQVLPGWHRPTVEIAKNIRLAVFWAMYNCFSGAYDAALEKGLSKESAIRAGLGQYNHSKAYADRVITLYHRVLANNA